MKIRRCIEQLRHAARMLVGMPSYAQYCQHMREHHPHTPPMSETEFFRNRQEARYGAGGGPRCC